MHDYLSCEDCKKPYGDRDWIDIVLPIEQWLMISHLEGILCANCIVARMAKLNMFSCGKLVFE